MKETILEYFKDVNFAYNDCTRYDTLKHLLDELEQESRDYYQNMYEILLSLLIKEYKYQAEYLKRPDKERTERRTSLAEGGCLSLHAVIDCFLELTIKKEED